MNKEKMEGFRALAFLIDESARVDPDPKIGRLMPKRFPKNDMTEERAETHIKLVDGTIIATSDKVLDGDECPHGIYVSAHPCPKGCLYYVNGNLSQYYKKSF